MFCCIDVDTSTDNRYTPVISQNNARDILNNYSNYDKEYVYAVSSKIRLPTSFRLFKYMIPILYNSIPDTCSIGLTIDKYAQVLLSLMSSKYVEHLHAITAFQYNVYRFTGFYVACGQINQNQMIVVTDENNFFFL